MINGRARNTLPLVALFLAIIVGFGILYIAGVAQIIIVAALLAYLLDPIVDAIESRGAPRWAAAGVVIVAISALLAAAWAVLLPIAVDQFRSLQTEAGFAPESRAITRLQTFIRQRFDFLGLGTIDLMGEYHKLKATFVRKIPEFLLEDSLGLIVGLVLTPFITFFILKDGRVMKKYFIGLVPNRYFEFTMDLLYKMEVQLGNFLRGQFIDAFAFGVLATIALWILDVPYFFFIGAFAGIANLIPFVGPIAGASAAIVAVLLDVGDVTRAVYALVAFIILKLIDDIIIQPFAVGKTVNLHPVVVAVAIIVGEYFFGILGMLLIVPFIGFLKVVLEQSIDTFRRYRFD